MGPLLQLSSHFSVLGLLPNRNHHSNNQNHHHRSGDKQEPETGTAATASDEPLVEEYEYIESEHIERIQELKCHTMPELGGGQEVQHNSPQQQQNEQLQVRKSNGLRSTKSEDGAATRKLDRYGFILNVDSQGNVCEVAGEESADERVPTFSEAQRMEKRERLWNTQIASWDRRRPKVLLRRLRKGLPDSVRGRVWKLLGGGIREVGLYHEILRITADTQAGEQQQQQPEVPSVETTSKSQTNAAATDSKILESKVSGNAWKNPLEQAQTTAGATTSNNIRKPLVGFKKKGAPAQSLKKSNEPDPFLQSKDFKSTQDTIDRDIHRTYPRHNLFYEDERNADFLMSIPASDTDDLATGMLHGLCDPALANLVTQTEQLQAKPKAGSREEPTETSRRNILGGQEALRRVLRAYSYYDREVGYCQGMNFIAGMFLTIIPEEDAFWLLVAVMKEKPWGMRGLFLDGMSQTHKVLHVAERLTQQFLPRLFKHFDKENIHVTMYATQWILTQYTSSFKFDLVTRVWDCFLGEGWKIIYRVMLALLSQWQSQLLKMSFEEILAFFRELPDRVEGYAVLEDALKIPLRQKHIIKYEKEWQARQSNEASR